MAKKKAKQKKKASNKKKSKKTKKKKKQSLKSSSKKQFLKKLSKDGSMTSYFTQLGLMNPAGAFSNLLNTPNRKGAFVSLAHALSEFTAPKFSKGKSVTKKKKKATKKSASKSSKRPSRKKRR